MTREEFKKRWDSDDSGGGITFEDVAICAKDWGLSSRPKTRNIHEVLEMVLSAAGVDDEEGVKGDDKIRAGIGGVLDVVFGQHPRVHVTQLEEAPDMLDYRSPYSTVADHAFDFATHLDSVLFKHHPGAFSQDEQDGYEEFEP